MDTQNNIASIYNTKTALQILNEADYLESLWVDEAISSKGLAYLKIFQDKRAKALFLQLLQQSDNPVAHAYAIAGLYQYDNDIINTLNLYTKVDTSIAVNLKLHYSLFIGMRLADVIDRIVSDELHQQLVSGQEQLINQ